MAKKLFAIAMMVITMMAPMMFVTISLSACSEKGIAGIDGDLTVDINGGEDKPDQDPDPNYKLVCEHVEFVTTQGAATFKDVHEAHLKDGEEIVGSQTYNVYDEVRHNQIVLKRAIAEKLLGQSFDNKEGGYTLYENLKLYISVETTGCDTVVLGGKTYCHPKYGVKGATAALTSCTFEDRKVFFTALGEESLEGEVTLISDEGKEVIGYLKLPVTDDDVIGAEFDDFKVTGKGTATINEYETLNGNRTGKVTVLDGSFEFVFNAGPEIVKISANQPSLVSNVIQVTENKSSFSYTLDGVSFIDNWTTEIPTKVEFVTTDGATISRPLTDWTLTSLSFRQTADNIWANNAQLSVNGVPQTNDTQIIRIDAPEEKFDWELDDYAVVTGRNEVTIKAYETLNGDRTGRVEKLTAGYSANLVAGAIITKTSQDILRLISTSATLSGSMASFSYVLGSESFEDKWNWSAQATATFTLPDGKTQVSKPIKADYSVKSTGLNINGNVYSNAASLYADNIAVADGVQNIQVVRADIDGYKAIAIHVTTAYHKGADDTLISDGTKYEILYRKSSDHSQYIVRDVTKNGALIREYNLKNVDESAYISLITTENGFKPAYLYREFEAGETKKPKSWGYEEINGSAVFGVNSFMALTVYNEDPWIASVYANTNTLGVTYGNIVAY